MRKVKIQGGQEQARPLPSLPKHLHPQNSTGTLREPLHLFLCQEPECRKFKLAPQNGFSSLSPRTASCPAHQTRVSCQPSTGEEQG